MKVRLKMIIILSLGLGLGYLFHLILDHVKGFTLTDSIEVLSIIVNVVIGLLIVFIIQKRQSDDRGIKDYLTREIEALTVDYRVLKKKLYAGECKVLYIQEWFKGVTSQITTINFFIEHHLKENPGDAIQKAHRKIHQIVTDSSEFNEAYKSVGQKVKLSPTTKSKVTDAFKELKHAILDKMVKINRA